MKNKPESVIQNTAPLAAIRLGGGEGGVQVARARLLLVVFMRGVALVWLAGGVLQWADLLTGERDALATLSAQRIAAVFFFCILDFVAGVGLWLATPWGGVIWLVTVGAQVLSLVTLPGFWVHGMAIAVADAVLVPAYLAIAWYAGQANAGRL